MSEWQPIETAPKNENPVLTYDRYMGIKIAQYVLDNWWILSGEDSMVIEPTHWMPLPSPPAKT
jgi:hypothetical protein